MMETVRADNTAEVNPRQRGRVRWITGFDRASADALVRIAFWVVGIVFGALLTYTGRYFVNSDAMAYIEIADAFRAGRWEDMLNLTFSPGYSVLLAMAQFLLETTPLNELLLLKAVNLFCFILSMGACELVVLFVMREWNRMATAGEIVLPRPAVRAMCYVVFLVAALVWIRVCLMNPDMLVFAILLLAMSIILWIRENPGGYGKYILLGIAVGTGYLAKAFFFLLLPVLFGMALLVAHSRRKSLLVALSGGVVVALVICFPLILGLTHLKGSFSYGESGRYIYARYISGQGSPKHPPQRLHDQPEVLYYDSRRPITSPAAFDVCYWSVGVEPEFVLADQTRVFCQNVVQILKDSPWLGLVLLCFLVLIRMGSFSANLWPRPSLSVLCLLLGLFGTALFCVIRMEPRYIAPFMFLGALGAIMGTRMEGLKYRHRARAISVVVVLIVLLGGVLVQSVIDQSIRGLFTVGHKPSYRDAYFHQVAVRDFLIKQGLVQGDQVAIVVGPPIDWARMCGLKIVAEIPNAKGFLGAPPGDRALAASSLLRADVKAVVGKGLGFAGLANEGWKLIPGTPDYYALAGKAPYTPSYVGLSDRGDRYLEGLGGDDLVSRID